MANIVTIAAAILELLPVFRRMVAFYIEAKHKGWIKDGSELAAEISAIKPDSERIGLAKRLFVHRAD
jgi:hypothetical protein